MTNKKFAATSKPESRSSRGGACHCGKVGYYVVSIRSGHHEFFCTEHHAEAVALLKKYNNVSQGEDRTK